MIDTITTVGVLTFCLGWWMYDIGDIIKGWLS